MLKALRNMQKIKTKQKPKGIKHHAKRLYHVTPKFVHGMVAGAFVGTVGVVTMGLVAPALALSIQSPRDCDTNAVINCGALTTTELQQRYSNAGVPAIYNYFGISAKDIQATGKTAVAGRVYKNGTVTINDVVVATGAVTAGRQNISGSTKVASGGATFYTRPPSVSFRADSLAAFVIIENGQFKFAVLAACGNPVKATAVPKPATTPKPTETPTPKPPEVVPATVTVTSTQTPTSTPTPAVVSATTALLPNTGPGDIGFIALLSIIGGYVFHVTHRHARHKRHARAALN